VSSELQPTPEKRKRCPACNSEFAGTLVVCKQDGTLLIPIRNDSLIGSYFAEKYLIDSEIGRGGMSVVYKARHELMDRTVAIKMLQGQLVNDQNSILRFHQEAKAASCLTHPNVITVYDSGTAPNGQPYLVMDYLVGDSLSDLIRRDNHLEVTRTLTIFIQACEALEHAHQKGVLHRDLKASNIMLIEHEGKADIVKVVDFGIAKLMSNSGKQSQNLTQTGEIFGSPIYMSPEQCLGHVLDKRSDIYSMGVMLYETLTGRPPLMGDTIIDTMQMHVQIPAPKFREVRPDLLIPPEVERVIDRALQKNPDDRFGSMQEFKDALVFTRKLIGDRGPMTPTVQTGEDGQPRNTRQKLTAQKSAAGDVPKPMVTGDRMSDSLVKKGDRLSDSQVKKGEGTGDRMSDSLVKKAIVSVPKAIPSNVARPGQTRSGMPAQSVSRPSQTRQQMPAQSPPKKQKQMALNPTGGEPMNLSPLIISAIVMGIVAVLGILGIVVMMVIKNMGS